MANLRLLRIKSSDSTTVKAQFNAELYPAISNDNIEIVSNIYSVPDPQIIGVKIVGNVLIIKTLPMTPSAIYFVKFKSGVVKFKSKDGTAFILEDNKNNVFKIIGPEDPSNPVKDQLLSYLHGNIYNLDDQTVVKSAINSQGENLARALYDIKTAKNDNYLEHLVENERKIRGSGPYDRLSEEGAFKVVRVGLSESGATNSGSFSFDDFPKDPITLLRTDVANETLIAGTGLGTFNGLILTVRKSPVILLSSVTVTYQSGPSVDYDIASFGYQIKNSRYDTSFASTYVLLEDNQFRLSDVALESGFVPPAVGDTVIVSYQYKSLGRIISEDSVRVTQVLDAVREFVPALTNSFSLNKAPVVDIQDNIVSTNGITFLDPLANPPFSQTHQAFLKELPFRFDGLPSSPGEFSVDYENATVYVYGAETNDGTGSFPPVATYKYRNSFDSRLDYTYNPDTNELAASPLRELIGQQAKVSFDYENTLIPDVDFKANVHNEILNERIENRLSSLTTLKVNNTPITNVFRVFNETSGEIYTINRFSNDTVYFSFNKAPVIDVATRERVQFTDVLNELMIVYSELTNVLSVKIFKIILENSNIISATEDCIGSSYNSSASFSRTDIFGQERYFDSQTENEVQNTDRISVGEYQVDYVNGIVYVGVSSSQDLDIGTINYKKSTIFPQHIHVVSVSNLYTSLSPIEQANKIINYSSFDDSEIVPSSFDRSDERFLNNDVTLPYVIDDDVITVTDDIKTVRHIYDLEDLQENVVPTDFSSIASFSANLITLSSSGLQLKSTLTVGPGNSIQIPDISSNVEIVEVFSVKRLSDNVELWDGYGTFSSQTIFLSGVGSPNVGDEVLAIYNIILNGGATPIVDYNRGDFFADYNYLADEILVSYEFGDNVIDFRESLTMNEGTEYFVTYKVGALRDALFKNFGTLVDIDVLNSFDTSLDREIYRDSLKAALRSFTKGPTIPAIKQIVSNITKIDPNIIESIFEVWSLGTSSLFPNSINYTGDLQLAVAKFDNGAFIENSDETITFPVSSNLRLEDGSLAMWVIPSWNGLDNDATITFSSLKKDGYAISESNIYIGSDSHNPTYSLNNDFSINKIDDLSPIGLPSAVFTQTGIFIYYDDVVSRWKILAKDSALDNHIYSGTIISSGEVYDVKFIENLGEVNDVCRSSLNKIDFIFNLDGYDVSSPDGYLDGYDGYDGYSDGYVPGYSFDGISFMADDYHYFFDFGKTERTDRFSFYKDGRGYLNFEVWDHGNSTRKQKRSYKVSADIADWNAGQKHFIGCSWRINSSDRRDELHLFVDGFEVPNIIKYGGIPDVSNNRFRDVQSEIVVGLIPKKTIIGNDLNIVSGSNIVTSTSVNFQSEGILIGDTLDILELLGGSFIITGVSSNTLTLSGLSTLTLEDARFSVNKFSAIVSSQIDLASNIAISILSGSSETEIPGLRADLPSYEISKNYLNQNVLTLLGNADVGDQIVIKTLGVNSRRFKQRVYIWGDSTNVLKTQLPPPINLDEARITRVILPLTIVGPNNSTLVGSNFVSNALIADQPSNNTEGRILSVRMTGGNVDFSTPATVTINGTTASLSITEILTFAGPGTQDTIERWETISSVVVDVKPLSSSQNSVGVEITEKYPITFPDGNSIFPIIRFSFKTQTSTTLTGDGSDVVSDANGIFVDSDVENKLVIYSPISVAGTYSITSRIDQNTVTISPAPGSSFSSGSYDIFNISIGRSGFQNGFFTLETANLVDTPFNLNQGYYDFDYSTYLEIGFDPLSNIDAHVGSDLNGNKQAKAIIDDFRILSEQLTDVRVGESISSGEDSFTTDFTALRHFEPDVNTLMYISFDNLPLINGAPIYKSATKEFLQSATSVNDNFNQSLVITNRPIILDNAGYLTTNSEGTIEFWVSPRFDTYNDPNTRFYFDAAGVLVEEITSTTSATVKVNNSISSVLAVRLITDTDNTGTNYFTAGSIASDFKTINLGIKLPSQQTPVKVIYIPTDLNGDRISIYKDQNGFINFNVIAQGVDYNMKQSVFWGRDTWHRIRVTFKFNSANNLDELRLLVDGEDRGIILFGTGLIFGTGIVFGQESAGGAETHIVADINFKDNINKLFVGSDYLGSNIAQARIDNLKISNITQPLVTVAGQIKDVNFSSNTSTVFPVVEDAFTTFLMDFDQLITKIDDFSILRDERFGIFNFTLNIIDSFGIVLDNPKVDQILKSLIAALKPAQSKVTTNILR